MHILLMQRGHTRTHTHTHTHTPALSLLLCLSLEEVTGFNERWSVAVCFEGETESLLRQETRCDYRDLRALAFSFFFYAHARVCPRVCLHFGVCVCKCV